MLLPENIINDLVPKLLSIPLRRLGTEVALKEFGWPNENGRFALGNELFLKPYYTSADADSEVYSLCLPLFLWKNWEPSDYANFEDYERDKKSFQDEFKRLSK